MTDPSRLAPAVERVCRAMAGMAEPIRRATAAVEQLGPFLIDPDPHTSRPYVDTEGPA